jgi:hypothetical protein
VLDGSELLPGAGGAGGVEGVAGASGAEGGVGALGAAITGVLKTWPNKNTDKVNNAAALFNCFSLFFNIFLILSGFLGILAEVQARNPRNPIYLTKN